MFFLSGSLFRLRRRLLVQVLAARGTQDHGHRATIHGRMLLDLSDFTKKIRDPLHDVATDVGVNDFPSTEHHSDLDLVAFTEEPLDSLNLDIEVMSVRFWAELDLFDLDRLLLLLGLVRPLLLIVLELAIVHDLADRRICVGRNLYQIEAGIICHDHRTFRCHNTDILAVSANKPDFRCPDPFVDPGARVSLWWRVMRSASYDLYPLIVPSRC